MTRQNRPAGRTARRATRAAVIGLATAGIATTVALAPVNAWASGTARGDSPAGFWYGTDSRTITITGSAPYSEPAIGGPYGGYIGMTGNWAKWAGCKGKIVVWSSANAAQAAANHADSDGIGTGAYWFMAGPGVDPHYNGTTSEASSWGQKQAARTLADVKNSHLNYPVIFMDIEIPGDAPDYTPAPDNGWNTVYTSACSGVVKQTSIPASVDRADLNGYASYLTSHSSYKAGVYSAPDIWADIFGTGTASKIPNTYEWTYENFTSSLANPPSGWCLSGSASSTCARFFGGMTSSSKYALMWQWSGGGGSSNGYGDFDQIDANRTP
ncbi:MAG TPA: hypothetical protein VMA95_17300 [Streptosporangiaceae bacterium]|nr:hypothetical protein [Streptosporangiaceae bacterium]